jgi:RNA polymerase sigma-70 factor, ECF subfamily
MTTMSVDVDEARRDPVDPESLAAYRRELAGYCYRMLGSAFDAEDAVQEVMLRALRAADGFAGRSSLRSWLYRIATNVCIDMLRGRKRRATPIGLGFPSRPEADSLGPQLPEQTWISPVPDTRVVPHGDPAEIAVARETITLAFVTALQHLSARQRAVLVLSQVLRFDAAEIAEQLDTTAGAVSKTLQRARAALAAVTPAQRVTDVGTEEAELVARYVTAFEQYDIAALTHLLREDVVQSMPPYGMWLRGPADVGSWLLGPGRCCRDSRLLPTRANGLPAFGQYRVDPAGGHAPWSLNVLEISGDRIAALHFFLDTARLFPLFGLPAYFPDSGAPAR